MHGGPEKAHSDNGRWVHVRGGIFPEFKAMGLSIPVPNLALKKRDRLRKSPLRASDAPKKKRCRPPKMKVED